MGGDSIASLQVVARARAAGWVVLPKQTFTCQTVRELAAVAVPVEESAVVDAEQGIVTGAVPLTPIHHTFLEQRSPAPHHYNQAVVLSSRGRVDRGALERALGALARHHDALRLRLVPAGGPGAGAGGGWALEQAGLEGLPARLLDVEDLSAVPVGEQSAAVERLAAAAQASLDLAAGWLLRAVFFDLGQDRPGRLLLVIHHLAVDGVSWRILLEDLQDAYRQALSGSPEQPIVLPAKTTSFRDWARHLHDHAQTEEI
ncbi:non-ribosomal peptide synthetase, partial [Streptomyces sp. CB01881]